MYDVCDKLVNCANRAKKVVCVYIKHQKRNKPIYFFYQLLYNKIMDKCKVWNHELSYSRMFSRAGRYKTPLNCRKCRPAVRSSEDIALVY